MLLRDGGKKRTIFGRLRDTDDIEAQYLKYQKSMERRRGDRTQLRYENPDSMSRVKIYLCLFMLFASILTIVFINAVAFQAVKKLSFDGSSWEFDDDTPADDFDRHGGRKL